MVPTPIMNHSKLYKLKCKRSSPDSSCAPIHGKSSQGIPLITKSIHSNSRYKAHSALKFTAKYDFESFDEENTIDFDWDDRGDIEDTGSPWEGAVVYKRNPSVSHVDYCTTLERLGFGKLSTEVSKSRASVMGLRVTKAVKDYPQGTPVHISIDITRKKHKLRLDGILKTVITLGCNRYFALLFLESFLHFLVLWLVLCLWKSKNFQAALFLILLYFIILNFTGSKRVQNSLLGEQIPRRCGDLVFVIFYEALCMWYCSFAIQELGSHNVEMGPTHFSVFLCSSSSSSFLFYFILLVFLCFIFIWSLIQVCLHFMLKVW